MEASELGRWGEERAAAHLAGLGYEILTRNWHQRGAGEADIVALHGGDVVVIEVRTRRGPHAAEQAIVSISEGKAKRLLDLATAFHGQMAQDELGLRVDIVTVALTAAGVEITVYENAVGW